MLVLTTHSHPYMDMVDIYVNGSGGEKVKFNVHKHFMVSASRYFRVMFTGSFLEATKKELDLDDRTDPETLAMLVNYIYRDEVETATGEEVSADGLIKLSLLADYVQMPKLVNLIFREIGSRDEFKPSGSLLEVLYSPDRENCYMRRFVTEVFALSRHAILDDHREFPNQMLLEVLIATREFLFKKGGKFTHQRLCKFLVNEDI